MTVSCVEAGERCRGRLVLEAVGVVFVDEPPHGQRLDRVPVCPLEFARRGGFDGCDAGVRGTPGSRTGEVTRAAVAVNASSGELQFGTEDNVRIGR